MAFQHFYSRIPARMSMYNRADSYDTFAHSSGLSRELIEKSIALAYDNPPSKNEVSLVREGKLSPVYCQFFGQNGEMIQSAITYIPSDYTGERSSYLVHSLVLTDEEKQMVINSPTNAILNPQMFTSDLDQFDITSFDARPIADYPTKDYSTFETEKLSTLLPQYDSMVLNNFVYALVSVACGHGKKIFFTLDAPIEDFSQKALDFMNTILQVLPYHLRENISFVTETGDYTRFGSFNVKAMPQNTMVIPNGKGYVFDFIAKTVEGVKDNELRENAGTIAFFVSLLDNEGLRNEFLSFVHRAVSIDESLKSTNLKTLWELIVLFRQGSGMFRENDILPNDTTVYDFFCIYDKRRQVLNDDYRALSVKCLWRYPNGHLAIPNNIFSKIVKIYPDETSGVKRIIMSVVLDLIHTDIMRDKLFNFIKTNYLAEDPATKQSINADLARVFYGGFLQEKILAFFAENFISEPEETRDLIVDKLLLTIRTQSIQDKIIEFFNLYYNNLSEKQKEHFYSVVYEMLPEADELSRKLINIVSADLENENHNFRTDVFGKIATVVEKDRHKGMDSLLAIVISCEGSVTDSVYLKVCQEWYTKKIFAEYVDIITNRDVADCIRCIVRSWKCAPYMPDQASTKYLTLLKNVFLQNIQKPDLYKLLDADGVIESELVGKVNDSATSFAQSFRSEVLLPAIAEYVPDVFNVKLRYDGNAVITEFAKKHQDLNNYRYYQDLVAFNKLVACAKTNDVGTMATLYQKMPTVKAYRTSIANYITNYVIPSEDIAEKSCTEARLMLRLMNGYLMTYKPSFFNAYDGYVSEYQALKYGTAKVNADKVRIEACNEGIRTLLRTAFLVRINGGEEVADALVAEDTDFNDVVHKFINSNPGRNKKYILSFIGEFTADADYSAHIRNAIGVDEKKKGLFGR